MVCLQGMPDDNHNGDFKDMRSILINCIAILTLLSAAESANAQVQYLNETKTLPPGLPFSEAVRVDDTLYLSGQVGVQPGTMNLVPGGIAAEARQTMENIRSVLTANGLGMDDLVKCTVMMADIARWGEFNDVYKSFFSSHYPARSAFGAAGLALNAAVEVECIASFK